jgi:putative tryptophan/tyrosine transport system substrate-binding protein
MRRREFITLLGGAAVAWPLATRAQQAGGPVIGFLGITTPNSPTFNAFRRGLAEAGYVEGQNVMIEFRTIINNPTLLQGLVADLVRRQPAVIVATGGPSSAFAAKAATSTIPIVFVSGSDPVKYGLVASLNRPGGTVTGISLLTSELEAKKLNLLLELIPQTTTVAYLAGPSNPRYFEDQTRDMLTAGGALGRQIVVLEVRRELDFEAAFATLVERRAGALVVGDFLFFFTPRNRDKIVGLAAVHKIPTIYPNRLDAVAGGLMSYGVDPVSVYRQLGLNFVGQILKGAKPADLPVQQPTKFELVINLKTAKALSLTIPETLLATADEVIQ